MVYVGHTPWTEELDQFLRDRWSDTSAARIAVELNHLGYPFTKGAVIGRGRRLGLKKPETLKPQTDAANLANSLRRKNSDPTKPSLFTPRIVDTSPLNLSLLELEPDACRYACTPDDVPSSEIRFCGRPTPAGKSYCVLHHSICYSPAPAPRDRRPFWRKAA